MPTASCAISWSTRRGPRNIRLQGQQRDNEVFLEVRDSGVGIGPEGRKRIFQPFYSTKGAHGAGLGLGLSRKLAELYGGSIAFVSETDAGATFIVHIPQ